MRTLATRVAILRQFGTFAQTHGAQAYEELPDVFGAVPAVLDPAARSDDGRLTGHRR